VHEGTTDRQQLAHPTRQILSSRVPFFFQINQAKQTVDSLLQLSARHVIGAREKAKIFQNREVAIQTKALSDVAELGAHFLPLFPCVYSFDGGMPAGWMRETAQHSHGGRFASSVRSEKTKDCARLDCQREVLHGMNATVTLAQMMKRDDRVIHFDLLLRW
jgi:hypothetical protein